MARDLPLLHHILPLANKLKTITLHPLSLSNEAVIVLQCHTENQFPSPTMHQHPLPHLVVDRETYSLSITSKCEDPLPDTIDIFIPSNFPMVTLSISQIPLSDLIFGHKLQDHLVQDQPIHIDTELELLEELNLPENVKKLTSLHSQLVERTTHDQRGLSAHNLGLFFTTVDCIFDPPPSSLVQLPIPILAEPSILLTPLTLFDCITKLQARLDKARYELALLPHCQPLPDVEAMEFTDHQIVKEKKHTGLQ